jgi:hypothetical protein
MGDSAIPKKITESNQKKSASGNMFNIARIFLTGSIMGFAIRIRATKQYYAVVVVSPQEMIRSFRVGEVGVVIESAGGC